MLKNWEASLSLTKSVSMNFQMNNLNFSNDEMLKDDIMKVWERMWLEHTP